MAASHSFPEYAFRGDQKTGGSLEFPGNLRALGKGGKGTVAWSHTTRSTRQNAEVGLWRAPPSVRFEFYPMGPNLWA